MSGLLAYLATAVGLALALSAAGTASRSSARETDYAAVSQLSRCADCHYADRGSPNAWHRDQWSLSPHGRAGVGCERCHGGDPETFDTLFAHRGVQRAATPTSLVHRANLPSTCGRCHIGPFAAFQDSWHFQMLRSGDLRAPTCSTCHGDVEAYRLTPEGLENQCAECHGVGRIAPRIDRPKEARVLLEGIRDARERLAKARTLIRRRAEGGRRETLNEAARNAEVVLVEATDAIHRFAFDRATDYLDVARQRIGAITFSLNGSSPAP